MLKNKARLEEPREDAQGREKIDRAHRVYAMSSQRLDRHGSAGEGSTRAAAQQNKISDHANRAFWPRSQMNNG